MIWSQLVDLLRAVIFSVAHVCNGSLGVAVCLVSLALRLVLLPLTIRLARRALAQQRRMFALQPKVDRLRKRYANEPATQLRKIGELYEQHGVKPVDPTGLAGALVQLPIFGALFAALRRGVGAGIRFFWIGDLARPSVLLSLAVAAVAAAGVAAMPGVAPGRRVSLLPLLVTGGITLWILMSSSSLFALASGAGSLVNVLQGVLVRRGERSDAALGVSNART